MSKVHKGTSRHFKVGMRVRAVEKSPLWPCGATGTVRSTASGIGECCTIAFDGEDGTLCALSFRFEVIVPPPPRMRTHTCAYCAREQAIFDGAEV